MPNLQHRLLSDYTEQRASQEPAGRLRIFELKLSGSDLDSRVASGSKVTTLGRLEQSAVLSSGYNIPLVGLGTWKSDKGQVSLAVSAALTAGYRHFDCAAVYENEHEVGEALQRAFDSKSVQRSEVFVTSKLWNTHHEAKHVRQACLRSLKSLRLSYLDLYLVHWPVTGNVGPEVVPSIQHTWRAMEQLVTEGLVRSIGVSNFSAKKLQDILMYATIPPAVCQVECHPYFRNDKLLEWCKSRGIHVTAYSPLGSPDSASLFKRAAPLLLQDPILGDIAAKVGRSPAQVLIRWSLQHGTSVLPKSTSAERIKANLDVMSWKLSQEDYAALSNLTCQMRMVNGSFWLHPKGPYKTLQELWDDGSDTEEAA